MGTLKWYKRDPSAALNGMAVLTLEECGAYNLVLDLIYARDGDLPDSDDEIARLLRCDVRIWRRLRRRLMDLGKLYISAGKLRNSRADDEINYSLTRIAKAKAAGIKSGETRRGQKKTGEELRHLSSGEVRDSWKPKLIPTISKNKHLR